MKDIIAYIKIGTPDKWINDVMVSKGSEVEKQINLTEHMVGFADWLREQNIREVNTNKIWYYPSDNAPTLHKRFYTTAELLDIYLTEKEIITE